MTFAISFSIILPLPKNVIDYLLDDGTLVVSGRYETHQKSIIVNIFNLTCGS